MDSSQYLGGLALALTPGLGARMAGKLLQRFGSPEAPFSASLTALEAGQLPLAVAQVIPRRLREIYDPPTWPYVRGNVELLSRHLISIVGARRSTPYGNQMPDKLGRDLADLGRVISTWSSLK
jgi:DNA processing protein